MDGRRRCLPIGGRAPSNSVEALYLRVSHLPCASSDRHSASARVPPAFGAGVLGIPTHVIPSPHRGGLRVVGLCCGGASRSFNLLHSLPFHASLSLFHVSLPRSRIGHRWFHTHPYTSRSRARTCFRRHARLRVSYSHARVGRLHTCFPSCHCPLPRQRLCSRRRRRPCSCVAPPAPVPIPFPRGSDARLRRLARLVPLRRLRFRVGPLVRVLLVVVNVRAQSSPKRLRRHRLRFRR